MEGLIFGIINTVFVNSSPWHGILDRENIHSLLVGVSTYPRKKIAFSREVGTATRIIVKKHTS